MTRFLTRKKDGRIFSLDRGNPKSDINPQVVGKFNRVENKLPIPTSKADEEVLDLIKSMGRERAASFIISQDVGVKDDGNFDNKFVKSFKKFFTKQQTKKILETGGFISGPNKAPITAKNTHNDISKSEFQSFVRVRDSGVTNMFDTRAVSQFSGLDKEKIINIMKNFNSLSRKFPGVVR